LTLYVELLLQWRRHMNLTGLRRAEDIIDVLVAESLDFLQRDVLPRGARVLDLGTGAGVPGIPLAICAPDLHLTLLDRSEKKVTFLRHIMPRLRLQNCQPLCDTAEAFAGRLSPCQRFDAVVTRGVGRVAEVLSLAAPLLRPGGTLLLRKPLGAAELQEAALCLPSETWANFRVTPVSRDGQTAWVLLMISRGRESPPDRER
jgi:16S rRNA (guanine527-N7)-methyltransferase